MAQYAMPFTTSSQPDMPLTGRFHMPEGIYLLSHSAGCQPVSAEAYLKERLLTPWQSEGECWNDWLSVTSDFREAIGSIVNAKAKNICPVSNVSDGFFKFLTSLPRSINKHTVLMHADAFPSLGFVTKGLEAQGFYLKLIPSTEAADDPKVWEKHLTDEVCTALITNVHSNTGTRTHIPSITSLCREKDVFTVIDVAQSIGVIPIDIENWQANAVIGSCLKWLCGGSGAGFMWINQNILQDLKPQAIGWFSHQNPFEFDISHFDYAHDATRFWGGTPPIAPYVTALAGIDEILTIGVDKVYRHNKHLQTKFANSAGLHEDILSLGNIGGTICLPIQPEKSEALATTFRNQGVRFDQRGHTFRLSFHIYNTETEAEEVGKLTRQHYA